MNSVSWATIVYVYYLDSGWPVTCIVTSGLFTSSYLKRVGVIGS